MQSDEYPMELEPGKQRLLARWKSWKDVRFEVSMLAAWFGLTR